MDIKTAFLYSEIKEDIWVKLLISYSVFNTTKLKKAFYSLK
jgi:hypothetical protein